MFIEKWQSRFSEELSERAIHDRFVPAERYRISRYCYPAGSRFSGGMLAGTCFVLSGQCSITFGDDCACIGDKDMVKVPGGSYSLRVDGQNPVELVFVWELPVVPEETKTPINGEFVAAAEPNATLERGRLTGSEGLLPRSGPD